MTATAPRLYRIHGLTLRSALNLPFLMPAPDRAAHVQIDIVFGTVRDADFANGTREANWITRPGGLLFEAYGIGRFAIEDGRRIIVDRATGATDADLVSVVLGTALTAVLQQRRRVTLHAGALATDRGAVLIMGRSGAGKSTLMAQLVARGWSMLADDVAAIDTAGAGHAVVHPAFPAMRLWADALGQMGHDCGTLRPVRESLAKYYLPVPEPRPSALPVYAVLWLRRRNVPQIRITPLDPAQRVPALMQNIHRKRFLHGMGLAQSNFHAVLRIAERAQVSRIDRGETASTALETADRVEAYLHTCGIRRCAEQRTATAE